MPAWWRRCGWRYAPAGTAPVFRCFLGERVGWVVVLESGLGFWGPSGYHIMNRPPHNRHIRPHPSSTNHLIHHTKTPP